MKKSQILAALALAFALGVAVIPSANTYAYIADSKGDEITSNPTIDALKEAVEKAKETKTSEEYQKFLPLYNAINGEANLTFKAADGTTDITKTLNAEMDTLKGDLLTALGNAGITGFDVNDWTNSTYAQVYTEATTQVKKLSGDKYDALKEAIANADKELDNAQVAAAKEIEGVLTAQFDYKGNYITNLIETDDDGNESVNLATVISYAKKFSKNYDFYQNLMNAVDQAEKVLASKATGGEKFTEADALKALNNLNAAIAGTTNPGDGTGEGTNKPGEDNNGGNKAPDTGILANAEGNASTTVAMVAGIATALTAAGAGVVAYRNARRSSRK